MSERLPGGPGQPTPEEEENLERAVEPEPSELKLTGDVHHLIELAAPLEREANAVGIFNVFDDGGYRTLLMLKMFGLAKPQAGRLGDDARDSHGRTYELKTINLIDTKGGLKDKYPGVTTEHTLRQENVDRYRACFAWLIGVFQGNQPLDVWMIRSSALEPHYKEWEKKIAGAPNRETNNPKIPMAFVIEHGTRHKVPGSDSVERPHEVQEKKAREKQEKREKDALEQKRLKEQREREKQEKRAKVAAERQRLKEKRAQEKPRGQTKGRPKT